LPIYVLAVLTFVVVVVAILVFANVIAPSSTTKETKDDEKATSSVEFAPNTALDGEPAPARRWVIDHEVVPYINGDDTLYRFREVRSLPFSHHVDSSINQLTVPYPETSRCTRRYDIDNDGHLPVDSFTHTTNSLPETSPQFVSGNGYTLSYFTSNDTPLVGPSQCDCYFGSTLSTPYNLNIPGEVAYIHAIAEFNDVCFVLCVEKSSSRHIVYQLEIDTDTETAEFASSCTILDMTDEVLHDRLYGQLHVTDTEFVIVYNDRMRIYLRVDVSQASVTTAIWQEINAQADDISNLYIPMSFGVSADALSLLVTWVTKSDETTVYPSTTDLYSRVDTSQLFVLKVENVLPVTEMGTYYAAQFLQEHYAVVMFARNPDVPDLDNHFLPTVLFLIDAGKNQQPRYDQIEVDLPKLSNFDTFDDPSSNFTLAPLSAEHRFAHDSYSTGAYLTEFGDRMVLFLSCGYTSQVDMGASTVSLELKKVAS
jgi:hypothetical protein